MSGFGRRTGSHMLGAVAGLVTAGLVACGGSGGGATPADPGSVTATGGLTTTFIPAALGTESFYAGAAGTRQIVWSNTVGDVVYHVYYTDSTGTVGGLTVTAAGVTWYNGQTPAGYFGTAYSGGIYINAGNKTVTFIAAPVTQGNWGSPTAVLNGALIYQ